MLFGNLFIFEEFSRSMNLMSAKYGKGFILLDENDYYVNTTFKIITLHFNTY